MSTNFFHTKNAFMNSILFDYLFHLYSIMYDYDECVKKMDDAINNETDEDLKEELQFMKLELSLIHI